METDDLQFDEVPEGYEAIEVVDGDLGDDDEGSEQEVLIGADGERIETQEETAPRRRKSESDTIDLDPDRLRRERDEARAEAARYRQQVENREVQNQWVERRQKIETLYDEAKANIFALSNNADEPNDFINKEIVKLNRWKDGEVSKEHQAQLQGYMGEIARLSLPQYAQKLGADYGLKAADIKRIQAQDTPAKMEAMAETLYDIRRSEAGVAKNNVKAAKHSQTAIHSSGSGNKGTVRRVKAGSDEHLAAILGIPTR